MRVIDLTCSHPRCHARGSYVLPVRCSNCGQMGTGKFSKTHEALYARCPNCETLNLRPIR